MLERTSSQEITRKRFDQFSNSTNRLFSQSNAILLINPNEESHYSMLTTLDLLLAALAAARRGRGQRAGRWWDA